jgi:cobalt-zinc-cadmium efflux system protein
VPAVSQVHDLHIWSICSGNVALSVHVVLRDTESGETATVLGAISRMLHDEFGIDHSTVQIESQGCDCLPCES